MDKMKEMRIVHINLSGSNGGAAIAAYRLHCEMRKNGLDSKMLVAFQGIRSRQEGVYQFSIRKKLHHKVNVMINQLLYPASKIIGTYSFAFNGCDLSKENDIREADFIYLHWINMGMLSIYDVERILKLGRPVFWFMHDMWPLTGGCHHAFDCTKYLEKCIDCPLLHRKRDMLFCKFQFEEKYRIFSKYSNLKIIAPSTWLFHLASTSLLFVFITIEQPKLIRNIRV